MSSPDGDATSLRRVSIKWAFLIGALIHIVIFVIGVAIVMYLPYTMTDTGLAITDVIYSLETGVTFYSLRSPTLVVGLLGSLMYFTTAYIYIYSYIDGLWDRYFTVPRDRALLLLFFLLQFGALYILIFRPHYWYLIILEFNLFAFGVLVLKYLKHKSELKRSGIKFSGMRPLVLSRDGKELQSDPLNDALLTKFYLLRSGVWYLGRTLLYSGFFVLLMATSHIGRTLAAHQVQDRDWQMFMIGFYISSALLFAAIASVDNLTRAFSGVEELRARAEHNDFRFFEPLLR